MTATVELVGSVIRVVLLVFIAMLWIRFIVDWVQVFARSWTPRGPLLVVLEAVYSATDPPIKALRKVVPPLRLGSISLDLSFLIVFFGSYLLLQLNTAIFLT
nr:YggT family protein [Nocardioides perillae]